MRRALVLAMLLTGCASVSEVIPTGKDSYTVSSKMSGPGSNWGEVKQMALIKANEHCGTLGRQMVSDGFETHGVRGWSALNAELAFRCTEK